MLYKALNDNAAEWRDVPFSRDAWDAESLGSIETPLGVVTLEPEAVKSYSSGRLQMLGALRPCLEAPSFVTIGEGAEFYRAFKGASGLIGGYVRASVRDSAVSLELTDVPASIDSLIAGAESWVLDVAQGEEGAAVFKSLFTRGLLVTDFELALAVIGEPLLCKAEGAIPAGARWITVHPNGDGTKGVPVLVQEEKHGSGVFRVIGGAGGKLNYMKIRGVKSEGEYKQDAAEKAKAKKDARKAQVERDKAAGTHEAKQEARKAINDQRKQAERDFIRTVADAMGWDVDAHVNTGVDNVDAALTSAAQKRIHGELLQKAKQAVKLQREKLATDADVRAAAGLGEVPLDAKPDQLSVDDLKPTGATEKVVSHDFKQRAEKNGLTAEKLAEVNHSVDVAELGATAAQVKAAAAVERGEAAKALKESLDKIELPDLKPKVVEAKKAVALIKADKQLKAMVKAAREANKAVDNSHAEPKAYVLAVSAPTAEDVAKEVEDSVRTATASALLSEVRDAGGEEVLSGHVFTGAHNAINAVTQAVAGASLIDRSAVDVLGVAGVAQVLARRLHGALDAGRVGEVKDALDKLHAETQAGRVSEALAQAKELQDAAAEIELGEAAGANDLAAAVELSRQRKQHLADARKVIGQALGEGEAYASLIHALGEKPRDEVQLSLGQTNVDSAVRQLYALGLGADDFALGRTAGNVFVTVKASGMDKLAAAPDAESVERVARNLAIQRGDYDEDNWLPQGFANRPDLALDVKAGVADRLSEAYDFGTDDHEQALRDYIGARFADGDAPADILADIQSANFFNKIDDKDGYRAALDAVAPLTGKDGKAARIESLAPVFDQYADDFVASRWGGARTTLNRQTFSADDKAQDALHRALADEPAGKAAYKPIGELTSEDARTLRDFFAKSFARGGETNAQGKTPQQVVEELAASEPDRFLPDTTPEWKEWHKRMADVSARYEAAPENQREELSKERAKVASEDPAGIFSAEGISPEWESWSAQMQKARDDAKNSRGLNWEGYCTLMGGRQKAYEALQDCIRSKVSEGFAHHYNKLNPGKLLKVGKTIIRGNLQHAEAVDPKAAAVALAKMKDIQLRDSLRERNNGRYASGSTSHKMEAAREQREAFEQAQMGFFAAEELPPTASAVGVGERYTIGHAAEQKINAMMGVVGSNFESGKPVKLFQPTMSGGDGYKRQRAIKLIDANKRVILGAGVGSGKTAMGLGAFAHLHSQGKVKKGLFVVPSIVQGQFGAEALRFLKPGQFDWHCEPGGSYEDRLAAYKDPSKHFAVVTHQSFRDDILKMAGEAGHGTPDDVTAKLAGMSKQERADFTKGVLAHHGIAWDYVMADEAHGLLNRQGKENSGMSNAIEGVTDAAEYYVHASGDPVKNDASEAFSLLQKMDGARYHDQAAFMRRYGGDTQAAKEGLQRELARHLYAMQIKSGQAAARKVQTVKLGAEQQAALEAVDKHAAALRLAKMEGRQDIDAAKALAPGMFDGAEEADHSAIAGRVADTVGILKDAAIRRVINTHAKSAKLDALVEHANARKGKQGVVFARNLEAVESIRKRLEADGHRVVTLTGKDSSADKAEKIRAFNPDKGDAQADIIVCSDAGATGANLQSGRWLVQYDTPDTAMTHAQRQGRIDRVGQKGEVELTDLVADHESERRARSRLANKYGLRQLMTSPLESLDDSGLGAYLAQTGHGAPIQDSLF